MEYNLHMTHADGMILVHVCGSLSLVSGNIPTYFRHQKPDAYFRDDVLDLGGGGPRNTSLMVLGEHARVITTDIRPVPGTDFLSDCEAALPLGHNCFDVVLLLNVLEHIYHFQRLVAEIGRVLKPGGTVYLYAPFLYHRHTANHPSFFVDDYFRYGPETLRYLLNEQGGFKGTVQILACEYGPFTASANIIATAIPSSWLRILIHVLGLWIDNIYFIIFGHRSDAVAVSEWPMAYWVRAVK
jgi:SAM-dependent methyltransferase